MHTISNYNFPDKLVNLISIQSKFCLIDNFLMTRCNGAANTEAKVNKWKHSLQDVIDRCPRRLIENTGSSTPNTTGILWGCAIIRLQLYSSKSTVTIYSVGCCICLAVEFKYCQSSRSIAYCTFNTEAISLCLLYWKWVLMQFTSLKRGKIKSSILAFEATLGNNVANKLIQTSYFNR